MKYVRVVLVMFTVMVFIGYVCILQWRFVAHRVHVKLANEQTSVMEEVMNRAMMVDSKEAIACWEYVLAYYPSGTKQVRGSDLDAVVERVRSIAGKRIQLRLIEEAGVDFGESPSDWREVLFGQHEGSDGKE